MSNPSEPSESNVESQEASETRFKEPALAINRVYTKKGDAGKTSIVGGHRFSKSDVRLETYGTIDELNAFVGSAIESIKSEQSEMTSPSDTTSSEVVTPQTLLKSLYRVQHQLFNLGTLLATLPEDIGPQMPVIRPDDVKWLEEQIDLYNKDLPTLRSFVLPGGTRSNAALHICRTVCRRAERNIVKLYETEELVPVCISYINRLSDAFFVWSRWVVTVQDRDEILWDPNAI